VKEFWIWHSSAWQLADELMHYGQTFAHKTAIGCPQALGRSAFFVLCAQKKGSNIRASPTTWTLTRHPMAR
jgi:hypothetical protein